MKFLLAVLCSIILSASAQSEGENSEKTCSDLEQLIINTNPTLLTKCEMDEGCTFVMCQAAGEFANFFSTMTITLEPCGMNPGVKIDLLQKDGTVVFSELVTAPTVISRDFGVASITINVFVSGDETSVELSVAPITIDSGDLGFSSDFLVNTTSISIDQSNCKGLPSGVTTAPATTAIQPTSPRESPPNMDTCAGLDELSMNINPSYLADCSRDDICSQVSCEAGEGLGLDSVSFTLDICNGQPGITVELAKDGATIFNQLITAPAIVTAAVGNTTLEADVFFSSNSTAIGISIDPVTITDPTPVNGTIFVTDMLVNFTVVPFNTSFCNFAIVEPEIQNSGMAIVLSFELFLLTLAALLFNGTKP